jgi:hypothetical protein
MSLCSHSSFQFATPMAALVYLVRRAKEGGNHMAARWIWLDGYGFSALWISMMLHNIHYAN